MTKNLPSVELLKSMLDYDPSTGIFLWKSRRDRSHMPPGSVAGTTNKFGHVSITLGGGRYLAHRLAWKYFHGFDPAGQIDHANNDPADNRVANLRLSTQSENLANRRRKKTAKYSKGVSVVHQKNRTAYQVQLGINGDTINGGIFATLEEATAAYLAKAKEIHGEFANAG